MSRILILMLCYTASQCLMDWLDSKPLILILILNRYQQPGDHGSNRPG